jgi:hypothetical protein
LQTGGAPLSAFVWNEVVFRSFTAGNLKSIDFEFFKSLNTAVAKRLYRFLDKRFFFAGHKEFDLRELCCEHIGLSRNHDIANLKRKLLKGIRELEERGFLREALPTLRFRKIRPGEWKVAFDRMSNNAPMASLNLNAEVGGPLAQRLIERGVKTSVAYQLHATFPEERIRKHLDEFDKLMLEKNSKVQRNPPGFLVTSINSDYTIVRGATKRATRRESGSPKQIVADSSVSSVKAQIVSRESDESIESSLAALFWGSLSQELRNRLQSEVLEKASPIHRDILARGGSLAESVREKLFENYALLHITPFPRLLRNKIAKMRHT